LGIGTYGKGGASLIDICLQYDKNKSMPQNFYNKISFSVKPDDGQTDENPINPKKISHILNKLKFQTFYFPYFGLNKSSLLPKLNKIGLKMKFIAIHFSPKYLVIGTKL
jgi:hypothetical protein